MLDCYQMTDQIDWDSFLSFPLSRLQLQPSAVPSTSAGVSEPHPHCHHSLTPLAFLFPPIVSVYNRAKSECSEQKDHQYYRWVAGLRSMVYPFSPRYSRGLCEGWERNFLYREIRVQQTHFGVLFWRDWEKKKKCVYYISVFLPEMLSGTNLPSKDKVFNPWPNFWKRTIKHLNSAAPLRAPRGSRPWLSNDYRSFYYSFVASWLSGKLRKSVRTIEIYS